MALFWHDIKTLYIGIWILAVLFVTVTTCDNTSLCLLPAAAIFVENASLEQLPVKTVCHELNASSRSEAKNHDRNWNERTQNRGFEVVLTTQI
jgi:hypothetical protein